jgi:hypothetical protein
VFINILRTVPCPANVLAAACAFFNSRPIHPSVARCHISANAPRDPHRHATPGVSRYGVQILHLDERRPAGCRRGASHRRALPDRDRLLAPTRLAARDWRAGMMRPLPSLPSAVSALCRLMPSAMPSVSVLCSLTVGMRCWRSNWRRVRRGCAYGLNSCSSPIG